VITHLCPVVVNAKTRIAKYKGRDHLVAPVVMLVEGVHNGLYYPPSELAKFPAAWNGIPLPVHHPTENGAPCSCNTPDIVEKQSVGRVWNTQWTDGKLKGEVWVDIQKCKKVSPQALAALQKGEALEVSTGLFTENDGLAGEWNGEKYTATVKAFRPDHLALLPGAKGACSWGDGCGIRANANGEKEEGRMGAWEKIRGLIANLSSEVSLADGDGGLDLRTNKERSFDEIRQKVRDALGAEFEKNYVFIQEIYDSSVIFEREKPAPSPGGMASPNVPVSTKNMGLFRCDYTIAEDGTVKLADPQEVERVVSYKPVINSQEETKTPVDRARSAREAYAHANR
jgi:hypothetical protein